MNDLVDQVTPDQALKHLAQRLQQRLKNPGASYTVRQPAEMEILNQLSEAELRDFAREQGFNTVRRMGGSIIEFTPVGRSVY